MCSQNSSAQKEELIEKQEILREASLSYRMYVLSRRDFLYGILIGVSGSIFAGYVVQLDILIFSKGYSIPSLMVRLCILFSVVIYSVFNYRRRTKYYERAISNMVKSRETLSEQIKDM